MNAITQLKMVEILNDIYEELGMRKDIVDFDVYKDHIVPLRDPSIFNENGSKNRKRLKEIQVEINKRIATGQYEPKDYTYEEEQK